MRQGLAACRAGQVFAAEERRAEARAGVAGDRLDEHPTEAAPRFEGANEQDIQKDAAGKAEGLCASLFTVMLRNFQDDLFEDDLRAAGECGTDFRDGRGNTWLEAE